MNRSVRHFVVIHGLISLNNLAIMSKSILIFFFFFFFFSVGVNWQMVFFVFVFLAPATDLLFHQNIINQLKYLKQLWC